MDRAFAVPSQKPYEVGIDWAKSFRHSNDEVMRQSIRRTNVIPVLARQSCVAWFRVQLNNLNTETNAHALRRRQVASKALSFSTSTDFAH